MTLDGHAASVSKDDLFSNYYFPFFGRGVPRSYPPVGWYESEQEFMVDESTK